MSTARPASASAIPAELSAAYRLAAAREAERVSRGARVIGRKIGYTNARMWSTQGVSAPMWGAMFDDSVIEVGSAPARHGLAAYHGPRIEPEIAVHFSATPVPGSDARALLECIDWVAHAYEIVLSPADGQPVTAPRAIASGGMHGALLLGERCPVSALGDDPVSTLADLQAELYCDGVLIDNGSGSNVLGNPLHAVLHLMEGVQREGQTPVRAGDLITTGSMTSPHPIAPGQRWTTRLHGAPLAPLDVTFE